MFNQIGNHFLGVVVNHGRSRRYTHQQIFRTGSVLILVTTMLSSRCLEVLLVTKINQSAQPFVHDKHNIPAASTITTSWTT
ncbi:Uncharacterised protein [Mycobacterium tuberculosis]|nr:Uncharacterised protein [Mycobacterium tuberculosis]